MDGGLTQFGTAKPQKMIWKCYIRERKCCLAAQSKTWWPNQFVENDLRFKTICASPLEPVPFSHVSYMKRIEYVSYWSVWSRLNRDVVSIIFPVVKKDKHFRIGSIMYGYVRNCAHTKKMQHNATHGREKSHTFIYIRGVLQWKRSKLYQMMILVS